MVTTATEQAQIRRPLPAPKLLPCRQHPRPPRRDAALVFSERTDDFFAWTIAAPVTAAVDGAFFYTGFILLFPASRAKTWVEVRAVAFGVLIVAWTKLLATLLDTELFHFEGPDFLPAFAAWAWLGVYIVIPVGLAILIVIQLRMEGEDPPRDRRSRQSSKPPS